MSDPQGVSAFAPATVANVACGFDILGLALEQPGDVVTAAPRDEPGVALAPILGDDAGRLPTGADRNTAGVAATALLAHLGSSAGVTLTLRKGLPLASGLGGSAASAVAAVLATSRLLQADLPPAELLRCALEGERAASGAAHADNAAPCLYGGLVLVRGGDAPDVVPLPVPASLSCAVIRPHLEVETAGARQALGKNVRLEDAVTQWGNVGGLVASLYREDFELLARCLTDVIAEPVRSRQVPGFAGVKQAALQAGALGCSLSGSGPSVFALCRRPLQAETVGNAMLAAFREVAGQEADLFTSPVAAKGARLLEG